MFRQKQTGEYILSDDKQQLQPEAIHAYLSKESYWAQNIPLETVKQSISGSLCYGVYKETFQVGFARVITDGATFGYLADVYMLEAHRGKGLSKALMKFILEDGRLSGLRRFMLATKDAHNLYQQFGFNALSAPERFMEIKPFEKYPA